MTAFAGTIFDYSRSAGAAASANLSACAPPLTSAGRCADGVLAGSFALGGVITIYPKAASAGAHLPEHYGLMENKILLDPTEIRDQAILSETVYPVELWNVGRADLCRSITMTGVDGVAVTGATIPAHMPATRSEMFDLTISPAGAPVLNGEVDWNFRAYGSVPLYIINCTRLVVFSAPVDWSESVEETVGYLTDLLSAYSGAEQRIQLWAAPARGLEFAWLCTTADKSMAVAALLDGWQVRTWGVPVWPDATRTTASAPAAGYSIPLATTLLRFIEGERALLWSAPAVWEAVQIDTVAADHITVTSPLVSTWPAGSIICPLRLGLLESSVAADLHTPAIIGGRVAFTCRGSDGSV